MIGISGLSREDRVTNNIVTRDNSVLGIPERSSKYSLTDAEIEYEEKKKKQISNITNEIERRRASYDLV
mgnify:CR=1 FL=1